MVFNMLEMNKDLLGLLCDGFKDSRRYIKDEEFIKLYLNRILSSRLGLRLLCEHHLALNRQSSGATTSNSTNNNGELGSADSTSSSDYNNHENYVGIIHKKFSPKKLIEKSARLVTKLCIDKYGVAPKLKIDGHTNVEFPYLPLPLEYIVPELLKNSFRATCEVYLIFLQNNKKLINFKKN
jgi:[3-methyl-2-oxobutanoate dehydrogenase (acetyl-transferring)] kinase